MFVGFLASSGTIGVRLSSITNVMFATPWHLIYLQEGVNGNTFCQVDQCNIVSVSETNRECLFLGLVFLKQVFALVISEYLRIAWERISVLRTAANNKEISHLS